MVPEKGYRIGRIFGIDIYLHWTWFFVFSLLLWVIVQFFHTSTDSRPYFYLPMSLATTLLFFASVLFHEISHSLIANRNGVPIQRITLFVFGGVAQLSKDVTSPKVELKMAVAGPLSSYLLCVIFGGLSRLTYWMGMGTVGFGLEMLSVVNFGLGTFNLAPGFPLDGGRILRSILWQTSGNLERSTRIASYAGVVLGSLISSAGMVMLFTDIIMGKTDLFVSGVWFFFIGIFLIQAALAGYRQAQARESVSHLKVGHLFRQGVPAVDSSASLEEVYNLYFAVNPRSPVPVLKMGRLSGVIYPSLLYAIPRHYWASRTAESVARPVKDVEIAGVSEELFHALLRMERGKTPFLWVVDEGRLMGVLMLEDIKKMIKDGRQKGPRG